jgi:predicted nucleic acid-binding protein
MKVLIDTIVALNKLLNQPGFYDGSEAIYKLAEIGQITGYISASAITDIYYIVGKSLGKKTARETIKKMLQVFQPAAVTGNDIFKALELEWGDFEDAVQFVIGEGLSVDYIITCNAKDFSSSNIPTVTP